MPAKPRYWTLQRLLLAGLMIVALIPFARYVWNRDSPPATPPRFMPTRLERSREDLSRYNLADLRVPREELTPDSPGNFLFTELNDPPAVTADLAGFLRDHDRVLVVEIGDTRRAYPIRLIYQHGLVNDTLGDVPLAVIYCFATRTFSVVDRRLDGRTIELETTGLTLRGNLLLTDTAEDALWSPLRGGAISGPFAGRLLTHLNRWRIEPFSDYRAAHPAGQVMSNYSSRDPIEFAATSGAFGPPMTMPDEPTLIAVLHSDGRREAWGLDHAAGEIIAGDLHVRYTHHGRFLELIHAPDHAAILSATAAAWQAHHPDAPIHSQLPPPPESSPDDAPD